MDWIISTLVTLSASGMIVMQPCDTTDYNGYYEVDTTRIIVCQQGTIDQKIHTLFHELGHYFRFNKMTKKQKQGRYDLGLGYITDYASTSATEDFAEVFRVVTFDLWKGIKRDSFGGNVQQKYDYIKGLLNN